MRQQDRNQFVIEEVQLLTQYFDRDHSGYLSFPDFQKMVLPVDDDKIREDACQRRTYKVEKGQKIHHSVAKALADFLEREMNFHVKMEMLKYNLHNSVDWNTKASFNTIDNNREGLLNNENIRTFLSLNYYEASEDELRAIVRRIERKGTGAIDFDEFRKAIEPVIVKMN